MPRAFFLLLAVLQLAHGGLGSTSTLCFEPGGRVRVELPGTLCCAGDDAGDACCPPGHAGDGAVLASAECCRCIDVPLAAGDLDRDAAGAQVEPAIAPPARSWSERLLAPGAPPFAADERPCGPAPPHLQGVAFLRC